MTAAPKPAAPAQGRGIRLLPAFLAVGSWTLISRVLGLARDIMMAAYLGTGPVVEPVGIDKAHLSGLLVLPTLLGVWLMVRRVRARLDHGATH